MTTLTDLDARLRRIETKIVRGFEELGADTDVVMDWLTVDDASATLYVSTLGRSLIVMKEEAKKRGATRVGKTYDIVHRGEVVGTIII
jgi:hypothetical protein